jgi:hypothetical protein
MESFDIKEETMSCIAQYRLGRFRNRIDRSKQREQRLRFAILGAAFVATLAPGCPARKTPTPLVDPGRNLVLRHVTTVDTHDGHLSPDMTAYIKAGKIAGIDKVQSAPQLPFPSPVPSRHWPDARQLVPIRPASPSQKPYPRWSEPG